jgi:hypothetical protein
MGTLTLVVGRLLWHGYACRSHRLPRSPEGGRGAGADKNWREGDYTVVHDTKAFGPGTDMSIHHALLVANPTAFSLATCARFLQLQEID